MYKRNALCGNGNNESKMLLFMQYCCFILIYCVYRRTVRIQTVNRLLFGRNAFVSISRCGVDRRMEPEPVELFTKTIKGINIFG